MLIEESVLLSLFALTGLSLFLDLSSIREGERACKSERVRPCLLIGVRLSVSARHKLRLFSLTPPPFPDGPSAPLIMECYFVSLSDESLGKMKIQEPCPPTKYYKYSP